MRCYREREYIAGVDVGVGEAFFSMDEEAGTPWFKLKRLMWEKGYIPPKVDANAICDDDDDSDAG
jgi:hypothetical protein